MLISGINSNIATNAKGLLRSVCKHISLPQCYHSVIIQKWMTIVLSQCYHSKMDDNCMEIFLNISALQIVDKIDNFLLYWKSHENIQIYYTKCNSQKMYTSLKIRCIKFMSVKLCASNTIQLCPHIQCTKLSQG